jgi:hypothetical protein
MPFTQIRPQQFRIAAEEQPQTRATSSAMDDRHYGVELDVYGGMRVHRRKRWAASGNGLTTSITPPSLKVNRRNGWLIDRQVKDWTFTGIEGINAQDRGVQEAWAPLGCRSRYLGRQAGLSSSRAVCYGLSKRSKMAVIPSADTSYYRAAPLSAFSPGIEWRDALLPEMYRSGADGGGALIC